MTGYFRSKLALARHERGLSLRQAARLAGKSHTTLSAYERGRKSPSLETFERILYAWNYQPILRLQTRIRQQSGGRRDQEIISALELAEQFPSRRSKKLAYPKFPERR